METSFQFYKETEFKEVELNGRVIEIPEDWDVVRLGEIAEYVKGKKPAKLYEYKKEPQFIPYLTAENMRELKNIKWCDPTDNNIVTVAENEIILIWDGSNAGDVFIGFSGALASTMVKIIPKNEEVFSGYLYYQLKVLSEKYLKTTTVGTGIPHISKKIFVNLLIPLPPLEEQKKIAHVLRTIDNAIEIVDKAIENLERIKKATMEQLLTKGIVLGFMFDTNIFDKILDGEIELPQNLKYYATHIQYDEICKIPDRKRERREKLLKVFNKVPKEVIPTEGFVVGVSRLGMAKLGSDADGELYNRMLKRLKELDEKSGKQKQIENQARDILIALTSIKNNLVLVTEDRNLKKVVEEFGGCAITFEQFIKGEYREFKDTEIGKIPKDWGVVRLGDVALEIRTGPFGSQLRNSELTDHGIKVYTQDNVLRKDFSIGDIYISPEKFEKLKNMEVRPGDVLLTIRGTVGKAVVVPPNIERGIIHTNLALIRCHDKKLSPEYLEKIINDSEIFLRQINANRSSTTLPALYAKTIKNLKIPLPPLEEQKQIAKILKTIDEAIELKKKKKEKLERMKKAVMDKLLTGKVRIK